MLDFFIRLFDSDFMPHGMCYSWQAGVLWLHVVSDGIIVLSYCSIPFTLLYFVRRRRDLPFNWVVVMFGLFILSCGSTHLMNIWTVWHGTYRLAGLVKAVTAGASLSTAIALVALMPRALVLPSPSQLLELNLKLQRQSDESIDANHRFQSLLEAAPDAMVVVDKSGVIVMVNRQTETMFGYQRGQMLNQKVEILLPERSRSMHLKDCAGFIENPRVRTMGAGLELYGLHQDGREFPVEISLSPLETKEGLLVTSAIRDITQRKLADARVRQLNQELAQRVEELQSANRELEAFAYSVSHDLRAPIRHLDGFAALLFKGGYSLLAAKEQRYLDKIIASSKRMGTLIDDLLTFSRLGRKEVARTRVSLQRLQQEVRRSLEVDTAGRQLTWAIEELPEVYGDPSLLFQVLFNLLSNAVKYTGGRAETRIEIGSQPTPAGYITVFVRDNGVGFDMAYSNKLFKLFQRLHSEEFEGTGVGLANVRRIVERHGGRVWAEGVVDQGATFYFTVPTPPENRLREPSSTA